MEDTQQIEIGSGQDLSAIANQPKIKFDIPSDDLLYQPSDDSLDFNTETPNKYPMSYEDPEMRKKHKRLIKILRGYANSSFGKRGILNEYELDADTLQTQSVETLENLLEDVKFSVGMSNSTTFSADMFKMGIYGIEAAITSSGMADLTGFTHAMLTTPNMNDYLEELALDFQEYTTVRPSLKIAFIGLQKGMQVNTFNQQKKELTSQLNTDKVSNKAKELGEDL